MHIPKLVALGNESKINETDQSRWGPPTLKTEQITLCKSLVRILGWMLYLTENFTVSVHHICRDA